MWVRIAEWMLAEGEWPRPQPGSILRSVGVRVIGVLTAADEATRDGMVPIARTNAQAPRAFAYAATGIAGRSRDVWTKPRFWARRKRLFAEFVLSIGVDQYQVQFTGDAADVTPGMRATVTGRLELVAAYEWESFELHDTRANWLVIEVIDLPDGDLFARLATTALAPA